MADDNHENGGAEGGAAEAAPPAPRRRAPRSPTAKKPGPKPKGVVTRVEEAGSRAAAAAKEAVTDAGESVVRAVKPRSTKRATTRTTTANRGRAATASEGASTRGKSAAGTGAKRPGPKPGTTRRKRAETKTTLEKATDRIGGKWAAAAIASVAAAGATAAAMLTLRGSTDRSRNTPKKPIDSGDRREDHGTVAKGTAHQPDGTDSSASFQAGIADENTVPDKV